MTQPHATDAALGARIRLRRRELGLTQVALAEALGLSFQQVQKYERGANRVSASMLHRVAVTLQTSVAWLFGAEDEAESEDIGETDLHRFLNTEEGRELAESYVRLTASQRRVLLGLVRGLVEDSDTRAA
jgi:transcriptional regulator with XRE-family HTH domain